MSNVVEIKNLTKRFPSLEKPLFDRLSIEINESSVITGVSGSGKTTFMQIIAGLDTFDQGDVAVLGKSLSSLSSSQVTTFRRKEFGFIYQFHHLLNDFNVLENVKIPLLLNGYDDDKATKKAKNLIRQVGLSERLHHFPNQLSGGERQRVAVCRAVIHDPKIIFADEPTGNLDKKNSRIVIDLLIKLAKEKSISLIMVTHDLSVLKKFKNKLEFVDGKLKKC